MFSSLGERMDLLLLPNHRLLSFLLNSQSVSLGTGIVSHWCKTKFSS